MNYTAIYLFLFLQAGMSPLVAGQLKDYANQKMISKKKKSLKKNKADLSNANRQPRFVVIGQETVEPLAAFRTLS